MDHVLITLSDDEIGNGRLVETFEARLRKGLSESVRTFALLLRPEQEASIDLLDWLEQWTKRYREAGKRLIVISRTPYQFEALELSHPEQHLSYFSSIEEWESAFPQEPPAEPEVPPPLAAVPSPAAVPPPAFVPPVPAPMVQQFSQGLPQQKAGFDARIDLPAFEMPQGSFPTVEVGGVVEIAGEYSCQGCGAHRTWLKGDIIEACDNVECLNPRSGWKLSCDLF